MLGKAPSSANRYACTSKLEPEVRLCHRRAAQCRPLFLNPRQITGKKMAPVRPALFVVTNLVRSGIFTFAHIFAIIFENNAKRHCKRISMHEGINRMPPDFGDHQCIKGLAETEPEVTEASIRREVRTPVVSQCAKTGDINSKIDGTMITKNESIVLQKRIKRYLF